MIKQHKARKSLRIFGIIASVSIFLGLISTCIPWGTEDRFHGTGFPFAAVYWDNASRYYDYVSKDNDYFIDFPNPLAVVLNPVAYFVVGISAWGIVKLMIVVYRKICGSRTAEVHNKKLKATDKFAP